MYVIDKENKASGERSKREAVWKAWSESAISVEELSFSGVHLKNRSYGPYMALEGVVKNNAKYNLSQFAVSVTLKDCEDKTKEVNCQLVGQATGLAHHLSSQRADTILHKQ